MFLLTEDIQIRPRFMLENTLCLIHSVVLYSVSILSFISFHFGNNKTIIRALLVICFTLLGKLTLDLPKIVIVLFHKFITRCAVNGIVRQTIGTPNIPVTPSGMC